MGMLSFSRLVRSSESADALSSTDEDFGGNFCVCAARTALNRWNRKRNVWSLLCSGLFFTNSLDVFMEQDVCVVKRTSFFFDDAWHLF
jgi:hypothetical protein